MDNRDEPRYRQVAKQLRAEITSGDFKPGDPLPTEMALCDEYTISRYTAREALRILAEDGLIERRQGAGTIVADGSAVTFASPTGDFESILQYAREATFVLIDSIEADADTLRDLSLSGRYRKFTGLRRVASQAPVALNTVFVAAAFAPDNKTIDHLAESVSAWIERHHPVRIEEIEQHIDAVVLEKSQAKRLDVPTGTAALRTMRRYRDAAGKVVLLSKSLHPTGRFAYTMTMARKR